MTTAERSGAKRREHLTDGELEEWLEQARETERERIEGHLSVCDACGDRYRSLLEAEPPASPLRLDVKRFVERGLAMTPPSSPRRNDRRPVYWASAAAALAACLLVVTLLPRFLSDGPRPGDVLRGAEPRAVAPVGNVDGVPAFEWSVDSDTVLVEIFDRSRQRIYSARHRGTSMSVDSTLAALLTPGESYSWMVTRLDARGSRLESSALVEFHVSDR